MSAMIRKPTPIPENPYIAYKALGWQVSAHSYSWSPPTDVYEDEVSFTVRVEVAGMRESDFMINIDKSYLVVSGTRTDSPERRAYHQMEIRFGEFSTAIELPANVDISKAEAIYEDGFLTIVLPKVKPTEITIKG
jgi:HSP20 family protein